MSAIACQTESPVAPGAAPPQPAAAIDFFGLDRDGLAAWFAARGERPFRAAQVMKWLYHQGVTDCAAMTDLALDLRRRLAGEVHCRPPVVLDEHLSADGVVKWLLGMAGGHAVETVFIPEPRRGTLCISSQIGCALNCSFCATGAKGFARNLETAEIVGQVWRAAERLGHRRHGAQKITNVVFMGMGEPLLNFAAVLPALRILRDDFGFGLAARRVTVSTAGVVPMIDQLREAADVALAVSLHAPDDELRNELVPLNRKYPIAELLAACRRYVKGRHKAKITFEYTLIDGVNDSEHHARRLARLLGGVPSKLNLIPFNPFPGNEYRTADEARILAFQRTVRERGIVTTVRRTRGDQIAAACGQLVGRFTDRTRRRAGRLAPVAV